MIANIIFHQFQPLALALRWFPHSNEPNPPAKITAFIFLNLLIIFFI